MNQSNSASYPLLYSFRRCPYAMRARITLCLLGINAELREVDLKHKPESLLTYSPKGTVPVLVLENGTVIDESLDVMTWAHSQFADAHYDWDALHPLVTANDEEFTEPVRRYKYYENYPEHDQAYYRQQCFPFMMQLEARLSRSAYLTGESLTLVDIALLPFVRQFAKVDWPWFSQSQFTHVLSWLSPLTATTAFEQSMIKYPIWQPNQSPFHLLDK